MQGSTCRLLRPHRPDVARSSRATSTRHAGFNFVFSFVKIAGSGILGRRPAPRPRPAASRTAKHTIAVRVVDEESTVNELGARAIESSATRRDDDRGGLRLHRPVPLRIHNESFGGRLGLRLRRSVTGGARTHRDRRGGQVLFARTTTSQAGRPAAEAPGQRRPFVGFTTCRHPLTTASTTWRVRVDAYGRAASRTAQVRERQLNVRTLKQVTVRGGACPRPYRTKGGIPSRPFLG